jgi:hypothetical protein
LATFGGGAAALFMATSGLIPLLARVTRLEPLLCWFVAGSLGVFVPLLLRAGLLLHVEGATWDRRLWDRE